ncbi:hypothetical protein GCM10028778_03250 [Barrientosiimonas marina]|uniref:Flagellar hook-length control protein FliK n=1 Tax=Lentibacillus kimchii TaxID=1542911 RepID=A0ABW2UTC5_9BACI
MHVHNRVSSTANVTSKARTLRPGQIIQGDVVKLYPNQKAQIQLGSQKLMAKLEAPLSSGGKYHFQVQPSEDVVHLRVIGEELPKQETGSTTALLQQLSLKTSKANVNLAQTLVDEKIPFTKEQLKQAFQLLHSHKSDAQAHQTLKGMLSAGLPITESVYKALVSMNTTALSDQLQSLLQQLQENPDPSKLEKQLMYRLTQLLGKGDQVTSPKEQFLSEIKQMLDVTGLTYENQLARNQFHRQGMTLKSMLMQMVSQNDGVLHNQSQQLLHFLNGMQIQSVNETSYAIQANMYLPGAPLQLPGDIQLEFSSNKTESGAINPDSCRILFYLNLTNLNETIIDMHVQKRAVALTIYNDQDQLMTEKASVLRPVLKKGLEAADYKLSAVTFKPIYETKPAGDEAIRTAYQKPYMGVDYHI